MRFYGIAATVVLTLVGSSGGCVHGTTPPASYAVQEDAFTVGRGKTRLDVASGLGFGICCGWFGGGAGGQARARVGVTDQAELGVSLAAVAYDTNEDFRPAGYPEHVYLSTKLDTKLRVGDHVALVGGGGGGISPLAGFVAGDVGLVAGGQERRKVRGFGHARIGFSVPVGPEALYENEDDGELRGVLGNARIGGGGGIIWQIRPWVAFTVEATAEFLFVPDDENPAGVAWLGAVGLSFTP